MNNDKYRQFFTYLREYYKLRETTIPDFVTSKKYEDPVWLYELANYRGAKSILLDHEDDDAARVLSIVRPREPVRPQEPTPDETVVRWIAAQPFGEATAPTLREQLVETLTKETGEQDLIEVFLADDAEQHRLVTNFLTQHEQWRSDMEGYQALLQEYNYRQRIYSSLFRAQNRIEGFSETWEFVLGLGVVYWQDSKGKLFRRPLVTVPLEIEVQSNGTLFVRIAIEHELLRVENDFIADQAGFAVVEATRVLQRYTNHADAEVWELLREQLPTGLESFASRLTEQARYLPGRELPERATEIPVVAYAPVFLLRQRSQRSYTGLFDNILTHLSNSEELQLPLLDRIVHGAGYNDTEAGRPPEDWGWRNDRIALPKLSNDEQLRIVEAVGRRDIVVVQGPPGTGKSHSIANVLTYLLGQGKKVLITAKTDQALQALQHHIPRSFADLIIFFLRGAEKQGDELVASVNSLQRLVEDYDKRKTTDSINLLNERLLALRNERSGLLHSIRELEQREHRPCDLNEAYRNEPLHQLIERLLAERSAHEWLQREDSILEEQLLHKDDLVEWIALSGRPDLRSFDSTARTALDMNRLPLPERLRELCVLREELAAVETTSWERNERVPLSEFRQLVNEWLSFPPLPATDLWHAAFREDYGSAKGAYWQQRLAETERALDELTPLATHELYRKYDFSVPEEISPKQLRADVRVVKECVNGGTSLTGFLSKLLVPSQVKQRSYVYEQCRENGQPCTTAAQLDRLSTHAEVLCIVSELAGSWHRFPLQRQRLVDKQRDYRERLVQLRDLLDRYGPYLMLRDQLAQQLDRSFSELEHADAADQLHRVIYRYELHDKASAIAAELERATTYVRQVAGGERRCGDLCAAVDALDTDAYRDLLDDHRTLSKRVAEHENYVQVEKRARLTFPGTVTRLSQLGVGELPAPAKVVQAIYWRHADTLLGERFGQGLDGLYGQIKRVDDHLRQAAEEKLKLAATKHFLSGLGSIDAFSSGLIRWSQAAKYSSGNSKRAFRSRIQAKQQLRQISQDIPCWVMPIYKLADTLGPEPELFDVVIVDEASQLGPEASFLQYITKRIIVVGDDQQTAPEPIGVKDDQVNSLIRAHLGDIPDAKFYQKEYSFFDHASANAGRPITLREHFRCMPEIIEFSNQICYQPIGTPLIPLKQYGGDRLPPLQAQFVRNGSTSSNKVNAAEAEAIVKHIIKLLANSRYSDLTMGIITLLGDAQVKEIDARLDQTYGGAIPIEEKMKRRIRCGKPADFQGDERDIIFLSLVVAPDYNFHAVTTDNDKRRFNVAMSRAKQQVILFHSVQLEDLRNPKSYRYKLLHYFRHQHVGQSAEELILPTGPRDRKPEGVFDSWFEVDVCRDIRASGYRVEPQFRAGPYKIDLVVHLDGGGRIAVECDGDIWHGQEQQEADMRRQLQLERAGWTFFRLLYSDYRYRPKASLAHLWTLLEQHTITPTSPEESVAPEVPPEPVAPVQQTDPITEVGPPYPAPATPAQKADLPVEEDERDTLVFTDQAQVHFSRTGARVIELADGEREVYRMKTSDYVGYVLFGYANGRVDKVTMEAFTTQRSVLKNAFNLEAGLVFIKHYKAEKDLAAMSSKNRVIVFNTAQLGLHSTRAGKGNFVFKRGTKMTALKPLHKTKLSRPDFYRKNTLNVSGSFKKINDKF